MLQLWRQREDMVKLFWLLKDLVNVELEHVFRILDDGQSYKCKFQSLAQISSFYMLVEINRLCAEMVVAITEWKKFPIIKERYKKIFTIQNILFVYFFEFWFFALFYCVKKGDRKRRTSQGDFLDIFLFLYFLINAKGGHYQ